MQEYQGTRVIMRPGILRDELGYTTTEMDGLRPWPFRHGESESFYCKNDGRDIGGAFPSPSKSPQKN